MQKISSAVELKIAIRQAEDELFENKKLLQEQFIATYKSFTPANLIRRTLSKFISPSFLIQKLLGPAMGLAAGYLFRRKLF